MSTSNFPAFPAPCFLATNRGFYRGDPKETFNNMLIFTSNIRQATVFGSFAEAEAMFKELLASNRIEVAEYFAVVTAVQLPLSAATEAATEAASYERLNPMLKLSGSMKEVKLAHPANCLCADCHY